MKSRGLVGRSVIVNEADGLPDFCLEAKGQTLHKKDFPDLWEIFKGCKCFNPPQHENETYEDYFIRKQKISDFFHLPKQKKGHKVGIVFRNYE